MPTQSKRLFGIKSTEKVAETLFDNKR